MSEYTTITDGTHNITQHTTKLIFLLPNLKSSIYNLPSLLGFNDYYNVILNNGNILNNPLSLAYANYIILPTHIIEVWDQDLFKQLFIYSNATYIRTKEGYRVILRGGFVSIPNFVDATYKDTYTDNGLYIASNFNLDELKTIYKIFTNSTDDRFTITIPLSYYGIIEKYKRNINSNQVIEMPLFDPILYNLYTQGELEIVYKFIFPDNDITDNKTMIYELDEYYIINFILSGDGQIEHYHKTKENLDNSYFIINSSDTGAGKTVVTSCLARLICNRSIVIISGRGIWKNWIGWCKYIGVKILYKYTYDSFSRIDTVYKYYNGEPVVGGRKVDIKWNMNMKIALTLGTMLVYDEAHAAKNKRSFRSANIAALSAILANYNETMNEINYLAAYNLGIDPDYYKYRVDTKLLLLTATPTDKEDKTGFALATGIASPYNEFFTITGKGLSTVYHIDGLIAAKDRMIRYYHKINEPLPNTSIFRGTRPDKKRANLMIEYVYDKYVLKVTWGADAPVDKIMIKVNISASKDLVDRLFLFYEEYIKILEGGISASSISKTTIEQEIEILKAPFAAKFITYLLMSTTWIKSVVFFCRFREPQRYLYGQLSTKYNVSMINGDVKGANRVDEIQRFLNGETTIILATYGTMSEGIDLQVSGENSRVTVLLPTFAFINMTQAAGRIARMPQTEVNAYLIFLSSKYLLEKESQLFDAIERKSDNVAYTSNRSKKGFINKEIDIEGELISNF